MAQWTEKFKHRSILIPKSIQLSKQTENNNHLKKSQSASFFSHRLTVINNDQISECPRYRKTKRCWIQTYPILAFVYFLPVQFFSFMLTHIPNQSYQWLLPIYYVTRYPLTPPNPFYNHLHFGVRTHGSDSFATYEKRLKNWKVHFSLLRLATLW